MKLITALLILCSASLLLATVSAQGGMVGQSFRCSRFLPCPGNLCCSAWGYCGTGEAWCSPDAGCQRNCWPSVKSVTAEEGKSPKELAKPAVDGVVGLGMRCGLFRPCPLTHCCRSGQCIHCASPEEGTSANELAKPALVDVQFPPAYIRCSRFQRCPLNLCCSWDGYCGSGVEQCGPGCQSNCWRPRVKAVTAE